MSRRRIYKLSWVLAFGLMGCSGALDSVDPGGGIATPTKVTVRVSKARADGAVAEAGAQNVANSGAPGGVTGRVILEGGRKELPPLIGLGSAKADPTVCAKDAPIKDESLVIGANGGVANVFVYLDKAPTGVSQAEAPNGLLDQLGCVFKPHALIVRVGQDFPLKNSDPVPHNVQTNPQRNPAENNNMSPGSTMNMLFKKAEKEPFQAKCAIHAWMSFYTLVLDHPFAAISDEEGQFTINNLPAGKHKLRVWHERSGLISTVSVDVAGGTTTNLPEMSVPGSKFRLQ